MRKKFVVPGLLLFALNFWNCSPKIQQEGIYQKSPVIADAELDEWSLPLRFGNKTGTSQYAVTNDKQNIYIVLLSRDETTEEKILRMGMSVYFDPSGGENKSISIHFPEKLAVDGKSVTDRTHSTNAINGNQHTRKEELLIQASTYTITGFQHLENRTYSLDSKQNIQLALRVNEDNALVYEAVVPIKNILGHPFTVNDPKKNFSVGIIIKGFPPGGGVPVMRGGGNRMAGRGMRGGRGMGSSNMAAPGSSDKAAALKEDVNWYKFRLADH